VTAASELAGVERTDAASRRAGHAQHAAAHPEQRAGGVGGGIVGVGGTEGGGVTGGGEKGARVAEAPGGEEGFTAGGLVQVRADCCYGWLG